MNESILFIVVLSLAFGFGCGIAVIRKIKGSEKAKLKLLAMVVATAGLSVLQLFNYRKAVAAEAEGLATLEPVFFGMLAFGALLSCSVYKLVKVV